MISRIEFYSCILAILGTLIFFMVSTNDSILGIEKARIEARDSIWQTQKDSALSRSFKSELRADSLQAVLNRKKLDLNTIYKKHENEKKKVLVLGADSSLSFFERSITH